jgi:hypothetical protein
LAADPTSFDYFERGAPLHIQRAKVDPGTFGYFRRGEPISGVSFLAGGTPIVVTQPAASMNLSGMSLVSDSTSAVASLLVSAAQLTAWSGVARGNVTMSGVQTASDSAQSPGGTSTFSGLQKAAESLTTPPGHVSFSSLIGSGSTPTMRGTVTFSAMASQKQSVSMLGTVTFSAVSNLGGAQIVTTLGSMTLSAISGAGDSIASRATVTMSAVSSLAEALVSCGTVTMSRLMSASFSATMRGTVTMSTVTLSAKETLNAVPGTSTMSAVSFVTDSVTSRATVQFLAGSSLAMVLLPAVGTVTFSAAGSVFFIQQTSFPNWIISADGQSRILSADEESSLTDVSPGEVPRLMKVSGHA